MNFRDEFMVEHHPTPTDIKNWTINQINLMSFGFYKTEIKDDKNNNEVVIKMKYYPGKKSL